jgi:outer membrane receptor protein involved in Fe transport
MRRVRLLFATALLLTSVRAYAQVTTATLVGTVSDTSGGALPGAAIVATNTSTNVARQTFTDSRGEFVLTALPVGQYSLKIEMSGFRPKTIEGLTLAAAQTVRQAVSLDVGGLEQAVTVTADTPLIQTSTSSQVSVIGSEAVRELPVPRRDIKNLLSLATGVVDSGGGQFAMNGVAGGGTGVKMDGTEANADPEFRSVTHFGSQNQISLASLDAIQDVQITKGIMPAENGGVAGGLINVTTRSGTNAFHGSGFYSMQDERLNTRSFFSTGPKQKVNFNQYGGSLGGPIVRNKHFFFATYEGYHEVTDLNLNGVVPNQATRAKLLAALPFPETAIVLDTLPMPTEDIVSSRGVVDPNYGRYRGNGTRRRTENHVVLKTDFSIRPGSILSTTYTRMRPYTYNPTIYLNNANDRIYPNEQDRIAMLFTNSFPRQWVSETRFGWNRLHVERFDKFLDVKKPGFTGADEVYDLRVPFLQISGGFTTPQSEIYISHGTTYSFEQKLSRSAQGHLIKTGFGFTRETGNKQTPENPHFVYQNLNDALANVPQSVTVDFSSPPYHSALDTYSAFIQDDWRVGQDLTLNLGLRYDYFAVIKVRPASDIPVEFVNMGPLTDLRKLDFQGFRDPSRPYEPDQAFGPRLGFAWNLGGGNATVLRGGVGYLYSSHSTGTIRQTIANPTAPFKFVYNRVESIEKNLKFPLYTADFRGVVNASAQNEKTVFSVFDPNIRVPYTIQSMLEVERSLGREMAVEVGYHRTDGRRFPLHDPFPLAIDRETGARPNPALGAPGGYYITSTQTMVYNALQASLQKRFSNSYSFKVNYTLAKAEATQGGDLSAYFGASDISNTQDFWDPEADWAPTNDDIRHRLDAVAIYVFPEVGGSRHWLNAIAGKWEVTGILTARTGIPLKVSQPSGIPNSRPDAVAGVAPVLSNWKDSCNDTTGCNYLNVDAFAAVPTYPLTTATVRRGTSGFFWGPGRWELDTAFAKNFALSGSRKLQVRIEFYNLLNNKQWSDPNTNMNSGSFGTITSAGGNRTGQVSARLTF